MAYKEGDTIKIPLYDGLVYETPPIPPLHTIRGYDLPKKQQVWMRDTRDDLYDWNENPKDGTVWFLDPAEGQMEWYDSLIERILEGEWIMIYGKPVYFNHFCFFFHNNFITKEGGFPYYKDTSLIFFYFMEMVFKDPKCRGGNVMKGRRIGVSTMSISIILQFCLIKTNTEQGIISKTGIDAEKIFKLMLVNSFASLPSYLRPRLSGNDTPVKVLHVTKPAERANKAQKGGTTADKGLNNKVEWRATSSNVFDGDGLWVLLIDEAGKFLEIDISAYLPIAMKIIRAGKQTGRIIMITTVNKANEGGDNYKPIWYGSNYADLDELGQTKTKMYRLFIEGYRGMDGWVDKYGNSVVGTPTKEQTEWLKKDENCLNPYMGSKEYCDIQRKNLENDPEKYMEEVRMVPYNPEEVFKSANNLCYFNQMDVNNQLDLVDTEIMALGRDPNKDDNGRKGWFIKYPNGRIGWKDDPKEGMWYVLEFLPQEDTNKSVQKRGIKCPDNTAYGVAGLDPYAHEKKTVDKGSDACIIVFKRFNVLAPDNSGMPVAMFLGKPKTKTDFHNQLYYGLEYFGIRMLGERMPEDWVLDGIKRSMASPTDEEKKFGYLVTTKRADGSDVYGADPRSPQGRESHLTVMVEYALNNMHKIRFRRLLKDFLKFDIKDRTDYDGAMALGYALIALTEAYQPPAPKEKSVQMVRTYRLKVA